MAHQKFIAWCNKEVFWDVLHLIHILNRVNHFHKFLEFRCIYPHLHPRPRPRPHPHLDSRLHTHRTNSKPQYAASSRAELPTSEIFLRDSQKKPTNQKNKKHKLKVLVCTMCCVVLCCFILLFVFFLVCVFSVQQNPNIQTKTATMFVYECCICFGICCFLGLF